MSMCIAFDYNLMARVKQFPVIIIKDETVWKVCEMLKLPLSGSYIFYGLFICLFVFTFAELRITLCVNYYEIIPRGFA